MQSITIDILNFKAFKLLQDLEDLHLIRMQKTPASKEHSAVNWTAKYKGAMTKQPLAEIDQQLNDLRNEWE